VDLRFTVGGGVAALRPGAVRAAELACHLGVRRERYDDVVLAVHECLANALDHGHGGDVALPIDVEVAASHDAVSVRVTDTAVAAGRPTAGDPDRGRGRALMRRLADGVMERSDAPGTVVTLRWAKEAT
jgi:anti-sigma regulatory factor (Ser/Thr protein kinase)